MSEIIKIKMIKSRMFKVVCMLILIHAVAPYYSIFAEGPTDSIEVISQTPVKRKAMNEASLLSLKAYFNNKSLLDTTPAKLPLGFSLNDIKVSGVVRVLSIIRNMSQSYSDMVTSEKNISFADYPIIGVGTNNAGGFPMLELNLANSPLSRFQFNVGYSFASSLSGNTVDTSFNRLLSSRQNLRFAGKWNAGPVRVGLDAGGILWTKMSRFTMGQTNYRDNYFDRVPWDWYRNSFLRYEEYYSLSTNIGAESAGRSPLLGYIVNTEIIPLGLNLRTIYGRTNLNTTIADATNIYPSHTFGQRAEMLVFKRKITGKIGLNYYIKQADTDQKRRISDNQRVISLDYSLKIIKVGISSEFGKGVINNPLNNATKGTAFVQKVELDRTVTAYPVSVEYYRIDYNFVSLDGSIMNTNNTVRTGGYKDVGEFFLYDNMLLAGVAQQVGQLANNRQGYSITSESNIKKLKIQIGLSGSQELQNIHDTVTIQHRVNSFSRSRFRPWFMGGGEYGRIKSMWLTTFETVTITDTIKDYLKGFNTIELFLKYKFRILNRDLVLLNFNNFNSIQRGFSPIGNFSDKALVKLFYEDITASYKLGRKYSVVANFGIEKVWGGAGTQKADNGKYLNQTGRAFGLGLDYDFTNTAGIHLRHKWMSHYDKNFVLDKFRGQETTVELKIFF